MKDYKSWERNIGEDALFEQIVKDIFTEDLHMSANAKDLERIGILFGLEKKYFWQLWKTRGSVSRGGDRILDLAKQVLQTGQGIDQLISNAANNSPFRQAYDEANGLKQSMASSSLDGTDANKLLRVLSQAYNQGRVSNTDLVYLWHSITGTQVGQQGNPQALSQNLESPLHLLQHFYQFGGGGIFADPANIDVLKEESMKMIYRYFPDEMKKVNRMKMGLPINPKKKKKPNPSPPGSPPNPQPPGPTPNPQPPNPNPNPNPVSPQSILQDLTKLTPTDLNNLNPALKQALEKALDDVKKILNTPTP